MPTNFVFEDDNDDPVLRSQEKYRRHRRGDSSSSLSYSVGSSVQSHSTAGESTDSSFPEANRILESEEMLVDKVKKTPRTITGQTSNSQENDGGSHRMAVFEQTNRVGYPSVSRRSEKQKNEKSSINTNSTGACTTSSTNNNKNAKTPPPRMPIQKNDGKELWYTQLWMCGFADSFSFSRE